MPDPIVIAVILLLVLLLVLELVVVINSIIDTRLRRQANLSREKQGEAMKALLETVLEEMRKGGDAGSRREEGARKQYDEPRRPREVEKDRNRREEDEPLKSHEEKRHDFLAKRPVSPSWGNENIPTYGKESSQHFVTQIQNPDPAAVLWKAYFERWKLWNQPPQQIQLRELRPELIFASFGEIYSELEKGKNEGEVVRYHMRMNNMHYLFRAAAFIDTYYRDEPVVQDLRSLVFDSAEFVMQRLEIYSLAPIIPIPLTEPGADCESVGLGMNQIQDKNIQKMAYDYYHSMPLVDGRKVSIVGDIEVIGLKTAEGVVEKKAKAKLITLEWRS
jgi:hypothetical protein